MPSKKAIRKVLLEWAPEIIDNSSKKVILVSDCEAELYNIISHIENRTFSI